MSRELLVDRLTEEGLLFRAYPYTSPFSGTMFIAVGIPVLTTSFWVLVLYALFYPQTDRRWFLLSLAGALALLFLAHLFAGRLIPTPIRERPTHPAAAPDSLLESDPTIRNPRG